MHVGNHTCFYVVGLQSQKAFIVYMIGWYCILVVTKHVVYGHLNIKTKVAIDCLASTWLPSQIRGDPSLKVTIIEITNSI